MKRLLGVAVVLLALPILGEGCSGAKSCSTNTDCGSGETCEYRIGSCSAQGECQPPPSGVQCGFITEYCGCNGSSVNGGCGYQDGYASGPTLGSSTCGDAGAH